MEDYKLKEFILTYVRNIAHTCMDDSMLYDIRKKDTFTKEGKPVNIGYLRRRHHNQKMYTIFIQQVRGAAVLHYMDAGENVDSTLSSFEKLVTELKNEKLIDISDDGMYLSLTPKGGKIAKDISRFNRI